jgi:hypothetical protein
MTHQSHKSAQLGPRTLQRRSEYGRRKRVLDDAARRDIITVPAIVVQVRAQTELNRRDRAARTAGGPGDRMKSTALERLHTYRTQNYYRGQDHNFRTPITVAQARSIRRRATRTELLGLMGRGLARPAELRTYAPTEAEIGAWAA